MSMPKPVGSISLSSSVSVGAGLLGMSLIMPTQAAVDPATELPAVKVVADKTSQADSRGYQAKSSSVATLTDTPLVEVPQTVNVVTEQQIADRQPQSLDEALATVSGLKQSNTLGGTQDAIQKRGFGGNRDNSIMRNGLQSVQARNFTPTTERIEVLKGPSSLLYGIQDPGGVINVVTKKPQKEAKYSVSGFGTSVGGGGRTD